METNKRSNTCNTYMCVKVTYTCKDGYILLYVCSFWGITYTVHVWYNHNTLQIRWDSYYVCICMS